MPNGEEFSDSDHGSIFDFASGLHSDSPRPVKRRRVATDQEKYSDHDGCWNGTDGESDLEAPLPTEKRQKRYDGAEEEDDDDDDEESDDSDEKPTSKRKIHEARYHTVQDPVFVTQLTQPPSSPSRIRGPRWQKPPAEVPSPALPTLAADDSEGDAQQGGASPQPPPSSPPPRPTPPAPPAPPEVAAEDDDGQMKAAIAASLESFREEESTFCSWDANQINAPSQKQETLSPQRSISAGTTTLAAEASFLEDIPDDAFDSSPNTSPNKNDNPTWISSQSLPRNTGSQQQGMRQTTLLGGFAQNSRSSQTASHNWPLASQAQAEPPTHHRFDPEALDCWVFPSNLGRRRDYQFNIAQRGLFHNLLVALPTGLGKTFIAATVMLNWYRWTADAQIIFVAPTKPLVSQQIDACFNIVGIPRSKTTMLTGEAQPAVREEEWRIKRVFFMTPQTLINDLKTGIADPKKIVLLVVDEAHRATGGYAYTQVVQFLQRFNSSYRVLALTATPGSTVETVQEVIDNLNISRVEIRTESSFDIREYVHARNVETQTFENSEEMVMVMDLFAKALQPAVDKLRNMNAYWARDPMTLTPYGLTLARKQWMASPAARSANWGLKSMVNAVFTVLASLAHAIDLLKYHGIGPFYRSVLSFEETTKAGKSKHASQVIEDGNFKVLMSRLRIWTNKEEFIGHPKLEYLSETVLNHFMDAAENSRRNNGDSSSDTRIMIFSHFRDSAEEIVRVLRRHEPMIKPHVFVGQASSKGSEGMDQKTQLKIVQKFKAGVYNTIVATSIGEEGLDIGEVDLIVCYDSSSSPIRMLQRMGRTGRKRQGNIVLLLMKGKEEDSFIKAKDNYEKMQNMIAVGDKFNYHTDKSPRIIPREIQPVAEERKIEIPVENSQADLPEPTRRPGRRTKRPPKKFHMPDGVETGFTKASRIGHPKASLENSDSDDKNAPTNGLRSGQDAKGSPSSESNAEIPHPNDLSLTLSQSADLAEELRSGRTGVASVEPPRTDAFPTVQRSLRPTRFVRHGRTTHGMVDTLRKVAEMGSDCESNIRKHFCADDAARYVSSPESSPMTQTRTRLRKGQKRRPRRRNTASREDDGSLLSGNPDANVSDPKSSLVNSRSSLREGSGDAQADSEDDSDIPDPDMLFGRLLSTHQPQSSSPAQRQPKEETEVIDLDHDDGDGGYAPQPSAPRRNRRVVDDDSDSLDNLL